jgi:hypothetical protein
MTRQGECYAGSTAPFQRRAGMQGSRVEPGMTIQCPRKLPCNHRINAPSTGSFAYSSPAASQ